jgi:hypothetical protein
MFVTSFLSAQIQPFVSRLMRAFVVGLICHSMVFVFIIFMLDTIYRMPEDPLVPGTRV